MSKKTKKMTNNGSQTVYNTASSFLNMGKSATAAVNSAKGKQSNQKSDSEVLESMQGADVSEYVEALENNRKNDGTVASKIKDAFNRVKNTTHYVGNVFTEATHLTKSLGAKVTNDGPLFDTDEYVTAALDDSNVSESVETPSAPAAEVETPAAQESVANKVSQSTIDASIDELTSFITDSKDMGISFGR